MNVVVVDLGVGNIRSLTSALTYLGATHVVTADPAVLEGASHVILPGVGAFDAAMKVLRAGAMGDAIHHHATALRRPLLGVCLGMQLLFEGSEEGEIAGLGLMEGQFVRLSAEAGGTRKVPHVGFSSVYGFDDVALFRGFEPRPYFYFTHSYALPDVPRDVNTALCDHARPFVAAFQRDNLCGAQFHPEKSQSAGLRLIANFLELVH